MAPFSLCSKCKSRTRKIVKDRKTFKNIYLCPTCCKSKPKPPTPETPELQKQLKCSMEEQSKQLELPATMSPAVFAESVSLATPPKLPQAVAATTGSSNGSGSGSGSGSGTSGKQKTIPPVMQTVVINGRKYLAISETASDI